MQRVEIWRQRGLWAVARQPSRQEALHVHAEVGGLGGDGRWAVRPIADGRESVRASGGQIGREPSDRLRREGRIAIEERFNPRQKPQGGIDEFAVKASVARTEGAVGREEFGDTGGKIRVAVPVGAQGGDEAEINFLLAAGKRHKKKRERGVVGGCKWRRRA